MILPINTNPPPPPPPLLCTEIPNFKDLKKQKRIKFVRWSLEMDISKLLLASLLISLLALHFAEADQMVNSSNPADTSSPKKIGQYSALNIDCGSACTARCQLSSRPRLCKRACGTCCARCSCVPPGTAGNYEVCPCYASLTTHGGRRKCP